MRDPFPPTVYLLIVVLVLVVLVVLVLSNILQEAAKHCEFGLF